MDQMEKWWHNALNPLYPLCVPFSAESYSLPSPFFCFSSRRSFRIIFILHFISHLQHCIIKFTEHLPFVWFILHFIFFFILLLLYGLNFFMSVNFVLQCIYRNILIFFTTGKNCDARAESKRFVKFAIQHITMCASSFAFYNKHVRFQHFCIQDSVNNR